jgi:hypothetical protein
VGYGTGNDHRNGEERVTMTEPREVSRLARATAAAANTRLARTIHASFVAPRGTTQS